MKELFLVTKTQLIHDVALASDLTQAQVDAVLSHTCRLVMQAVMDGKSVVLPGLGRFHILPKKARLARNPQTGEEIEVPASRAVKFRPSEALRHMAEHGYRRDLRMP